MECSAIGMYSADKTYQFHNTLAASFPELLKPNLYFYDKGAEAREYNGAQYYLHQNLYTSVGWGIERVELFKQYLALQSIDADQLLGGFKQKYKQLWQQCIFLRACFAVEELLKVAINQKLALVALPMRIDSLEYFDQIFACMPCDHEVVKAH